MRTTSVPRSVSSWITTASAPSGICAPVKIRIAVPFDSGGGVGPPARDSARTGSATSDDAPADATSAARTAYPSIAL